MSCGRPPVTAPCPGFRCSVPGSCWPSPPGNASVPSPTAWSVMPLRSGGPANAIAGEAWPSCSPTEDKTTRDNHSRSPPCNGHRSSNGPVWSRSPRGCTSPTGRSKTWPARRWTTGSSLAQPGHGLPDLAGCRFATPSDSVLEDRPSGPPVQGEGGASPVVLRECGSTGGTRDLGGVCR